VWFQRHPRGQTDRHTQTDRQTHRRTYSSQYFATAPAGEVIREKKRKENLTNLTKEIRKYTLNGTKNIVTHKSFRDPPNAGGRGVMNHRTCQLCDDARRGNENNITRRSY